MAILKAIPKCDNIGSVNRERVKAAIQLQRRVGLLLVDAVCLEKDELVRDGKRYRVDTSRRKSGTRVNNVVPGWLGEELLRVKNGNQQYFFWSGWSTPKFRDIDLRQAVSQLKRGPGFRGHGLRLASVSDLPTYKKPCATASIQNQFRPRPPQPLHENVRQIGLSFE